MKGDFTRSTFKPTRRYNSVRMQQGRVQLDSDWNEQIDIQAHLERAANKDVIGACGGPLADAGFEIQVQDQNLTIGPGHYYVDGILCENEETVRLAEDPELTGVPLQPDARSEDLPTTAGKYVAYLDVWERHVTALEDQDLREVALGGPDTATRTKTVWQVRIGPDPVAGVGDPYTCADWTSPEQASDGQLTAQVDETATIGDDPCLVPPGAGYRRLENQLYRVEVHEGGSTPTFKWSRENGSIVTRLENIDGNVLTVSDPGKDEVLGFASGQWVELSDEQQVLQGEPGVLVELDAVDGGSLTVQAWPGSPLTMADFGDSPTVRRWESDDAVDADIESWQDLEDGVQVYFSSGYYRSGDHWLIPARTNTGMVEWPQNGSGPESQPAGGIQHHYCPLAIVELATTGSWTYLSDCRSLFPSVTELLHLYQISGDGQEAIPGQVPNGPLRVGVSNGQWPVSGATVQFTIEVGNGGVYNVTSGDFVSSVTVETVDGVAETFVQLGDTPDYQRVKAALLDTAGNQLAAPVPIYFNANLSIASLVGYDPSNCPNLSAAGTVQEAIDLLCTSGTGTPTQPGNVVNGVYLTTGQTIRNDTNIATTDLASGLRVVCQEALDPVSIVRPTYFVTLEMPYPLNSADQALWGANDRLGYQPLHLDAQAVPDPGDPRAALWTPRSPTVAWLQSTAFAGMLATLPGQRMLVHLTLKGNFIWQADNTDRFVDGDPFGMPRTGGGIDIRLPSGDGVAGGDFEMWLWLVPGEATHTTVTTDTTVPDHTTEPPGKVTVGESSTEVSLGDSGDSVSLETSLETPVLHATGEAEEVVAHVASMEAAVPKATPPEQEDVVAHVSALENTGAKTPAKTEPTDLNTATADELQAALKGIDKLFAAAVVENRPYDAAGQIRLRFSTISQELLGTLKDRFTVSTSGPPLATRTAATRPRRRRTRRTRAKPTPEKVINVNTASQEDLATVNGLDEAFAQAIEESRPYQSADQLLTKASFIGYSAYDILEDQLQI